MAVSPDKLNAFMGKAVGDIGAAMSANMVLLGDKLGLYKAMAKAGSVTPAELAKTTKTAERYVRGSGGAIGGVVHPHRRELRPAARKRCRPAYGRAGTSWAQRKPT